MEPIAVEEVATFYSMYEHKPAGRHKICICTNISCMLCDSDMVVNHLQNKLGIKYGEVTADGKFSLKEVECLGACVNAPVVQIGNTYYENLTPQKLDEIIDSLE
jgi:NADH-quinone oxidoreductase subunit E